MESKQEKRKQSLLADIRDLCLSGGISEQEYRGVRNIIDRKNRETLFLASVLCSIMFSALLFSAQFSSTIGDARMYYLAMTCICLVLAVLSATIVKKHTEYVIWFWYVLYICFGMYAVLLNTYMRPTISATTLCAFLVAGPLLIIDRPLRVTMYMTLLSVVFMVLAQPCKSAYLAFADSINVVCCLFIGSAIYMRIVRIKLRDIIQAQILQLERDTDRLTGLYNKAGMERRIREYLSDGHACGTLVMMDIDRFKYINDTYGHAFGDTVIRQAGECIARSDTVCAGRFGGDEFVVLLEECGDSTVMFIENMIADMKEQIQYPMEDFCFQISVGAAGFRSNLISYNHLFQIADHTMYQAKQAGRNCLKYTEIR